MKLNILILLLFFTIFQSKADQIYELIKIPNLKIYQIDKENNLRYLTPKKDFVTNSGINNVSCKKSNSYKVEKKYLKTKNELNVFNRKFFEKIKLRYIVLCEGLKVGEIKALGFANSEMKTILLNINTNDDDFERVIHHEVFHIINDSYKEIFDEKEWSNFNIENFKYAECSTCTDKLGLDTFLKTDGFFTEYSQSTASEDMAEVFSHLMIGSNLNNNDPILSKKIQFIKLNLLKIDKNFVL